MVSRLLVLLALVGLASCAHTGPDPLPPGCAMYDSGVCFCVWTDLDGNQYAMWGEDWQCTTYQH